MFVLEFVCEDEAGEAGADGGDAQFARGVGGVRREGRVRGRRCGGHDVAGGGVYEGAVRFRDLVDG